MKHTLTRRDVIAGTVWLGVARAARGWEAALPVIGLDHVNMKSYVTNDGWALNVVGLGSPTEVLKSIYSTSPTEVNSTVADRQCGTQKADPGR